MFKLVLEKAEEPEIKLPTPTGSSKKQESSRKTSISALLTMAKLLTVWITINCGKFWKWGEYQTTWPASWETCMPVRKQWLELNMEGEGGKIWENGLKHVKYHVGNELPVQVRCMILDDWGWCTGTTQRDGMGREEGSGWGTHVSLWRIHFDIWQN